MSTTILAVAARALDARLGLASVPAIVRSLVRMGATVTEAQAALLDAYSAGQLELRPESGMGRLSAEDRALCPTGFDGSPLSWVRIV